MQEIVAEGTRDIDREAFESVDSAGGAEDVRSGCLTVDQVR